MNVQSPNNQALPQANPCTWSVGPQRSSCGTAPYNGGAEPGSNQEQCVLAKSGLCSGPSTRRQPDAHWRLILRPAQPLQQPPAGQGDNCQYKHFDPICQHVETDTAPLNGPCFESSARILDTHRVLRKAIDVHRYTKTGPW